MSKDGVEIFSDAVFAIILTLLVLELRVPNIVDHSSLGQYAIAMKPVIPKFVSFVLTFIIISIQWVNHNYFFQQLRTTPLGFVWINNFYLLWICFTPFPTAMLGDHPTDQFPILLYGVTQLLVGIAFFKLRSHATKKRLFLTNESVKTSGPKHSLPAILIYIFSIVLSFVNVYVSLVCFLLIPILYFVPYLLRFE